MFEFIWIHFALPRTAWYEQSDQSRRELEGSWEAVRADSRSQGGLSDGRYHVRGQSDYSTVEVWRFPSTDAAFDHWQRLVAAGYGRCFHSSNCLGAALKEAP
jgi:hypothetical protein